MSIGPGGGLHRDRGQETVSFWGLDPLAKSKAHISPPPEVRPSLAGASPSAPGWNDP